LAIRRAGRLASPGVPPRLARRFSGAIEWCRRRRRRGGGSTTGDPAMASPLAAERVAERGTALARWLAAGGDIDRLLRLDQRVRQGLLSEWPGRRGWWRGVRTRRSPSHASQPTRPDAPPPVV
jgi:hypothetical protein